MKMVLTKAQRMLSNMLNKVNTGTSLSKLNSGLNRSLQIFAYFFKRGLATSNYEQGYFSNLRLMRIYRQSNYFLFISACLQAKNSWRPLRLGEK
jgi:hypothetical protein